MWIGKRSEGLDTAGSVSPAPPRPSLKQWCQGPRGSEGGRHAGARADLVLVLSWLELPHWLVLRGQIARAWAAADCRPNTRRNAGGMVFGIRRRPIDSEAFRKGRQQPLAGKDVRRCWSTH